MNATAAPISPATATAIGASPAKATPQANHFGTDAVYKGYDLMVRKVATHIIREPRVTASTRADLVRAISSPAVTFAASAADGSILISCPAGLPEVLTALAEPIDHGPSPTAETDKLAQMLDQIERKLDGVIRDQQVTERVSDRLEAIEYALRERIDPEAARARALEAELGQIGHRLDMVLDRVAQIPDPIPFDTMPLELMLAASETRLLAAVQLPPDHGPVIDAVQNLSAQVAAIPQADQLLVQIIAQVDDLAARPVPTPDLGAHHQALDAITHRLDQVAGRLPNPDQLTAQDATLADIATRLAETPVELERLLAQHLNLTAVEADLHGLKQALAETARAGTLSQGLADVAQHLTTLADRPGPVLDLSPQNAALSEVALVLTSFDRRVNDLTAQYQAVLSVLGQPAQSDTLNMALAQISDLAARPNPDLSGLAQIADRLGAVNQTLGDLTELVAAGPDLAPLTHHYETLIDTLGQPAQGAVVTTHLHGIADQIAELASRPAPNMDLSGPVSALTHITATLQTMAQGLDTLTEITTAGPDLTALNAHLNSLTAAVGQQATVTHSLDDMARAIEDLAKRPEPDQSVAVQTLAGVAAAQADLAGQVDRLTETLIPTTMARLDTMMSTLNQPAQADALADLAAQIDVLLHTEPGTTDLASLTRPLAEMAARLDAIQNAITRGPDLSTVTTGLDPILADISERLGSLADAFAAGGDPTGAISRIDARLAQLGHLAQHETVGAALADLTEQLGALAERPDPVIDLTAQRQGFARFGTALGNAVERLEHVAQTLATGPDLTPVLAQFDMLRADLSSPEAELVQTLTNLGNQIAELARRDDAALVAAEQGQAVMACLTEVAQGVGSLIQGFANSPDMAAMLMQLQHDLTNVAQAHGASALTEPMAMLNTGLANLTNRLETGLTLDALNASLEQLLATTLHRLDSAATQGGAGHARILAQIDALRSDLAQPSPDAAVLADIAGHLATLVDRPDISGDMAEQKQNLADFAKGLADLVQWLEPLTRDLADGPDYGAILTEFDLLRAELNQPARDQALADGMANLSDQIADLAKSPDGLISLAEQRRSFASFSNALAFMLHRLDSLGAEPATPLDSDADTDAVQSLTDQVARLTDRQKGQHGPAVDDLANTLSTLILRLEFLLQTSGAPVQPAPQPDLATTPDLPRDPAKLIQDLARATTALAQIVAELEAGQGKTLPPATSASVGQLFDRLDVAVAAQARSGQGLQAQLSSPTVAEALDTLSTALHGRPNHVQGHEVAFVEQLRTDFAEFVAHTLRAQTEAA